jgi:Right handed beta helix region
MTLLAVLSPWPAAVEPSAAPPPTCTRVAAPDGSDRSRGTLKRPFATVQRLADSLRPGQVGCLRGGAYTETDDDYALSLERGGTRGAPITIRSFPGERAKIVGIVSVADDVSFVRLSKLAFEGTGDHNTVKIYGDDVVLEDSTITNLGRGDSCVMLGSTSGGVAYRPIVQRNRIHDCGDEEKPWGHGIYASQVVEGRITRNVFWNSYGYAIQVYPNSQRSLVSHNVIDGGGLSNRGGITVGGNDEHASNGNVVEHNIIAFAATYGVSAQDERGSGNVVRFNCFWQNRDGNLDEGVVGRENIVAPPGFVHREKRKYAVRANSLCRRVF